MVISKIEFKDGRRRAHRAQRSPFIERRLSLFERRPHVSDEGSYFLPFWNKKQIPCIFLLLLSKSRQRIPLPPSRLRRQGKQSVCAPSLDRYYRDVRRPRVNFFFPFFHFLLFSFSFPFFRLISKSVARLTCHETVFEKSWKGLRVRIKPLLMSTPQVVVAIA